ncbi:MAG: putative sulfate exporter family transporter [Beijerinckiaceae bacterium]
MRPSLRGLLFFAIVRTAVVTIAASYGISRLLGQPARLAILIGWENSICGNSAIAAVAPMIGVDGKDITSSIAFTEILGVLIRSVWPC